MNETKKILLILFLLLLISCSYAKSDKNILYGIPGKNGQLIYRESYALLHDNAKKIPLWVSYHLTRDDLKGTQKRTDDFRPDPELPKGKRAELSDYKGSGYDRGHMAPAGDMKRSYKVMSESFFLSNMLPQTANLNRGLWKKLEEKVRELTRLRGSAFIICGPVFKNLYKERIGKNKIWVPPDCYKIIVDQGKGNKIDVASFIIPNQKVSGSLIKYLTTVDYIEKLTRLDFLSELPDGIEKKVEARITKNKAFWATKSTSKSYKKKSTNKKQNLTAGTYSGNTSSKIFHKKGCRYYNCNNCTTVFNSKDEAVANGYRACKVCKP